MKYTSKLISLLIMTLYSSVFANTLHSMTRERVRSALINKTLISIPTDNLNGKTINNTFSLYFDGKGNAYGGMTLKPKDQPKTDTGIYSINRDGSFYITWKHWDESKKFCGNFYETKNAYLAISCDNVFHTVFMKESIKNGKNF